MRNARLLQLTLSLAFSLVFSLPSVAQGSTGKALTNADIGRMLQAGIPENIIVREIQLSKTDLGTGPAALIELKNRGASERILEAVLDSHSGSGQAVRESLPASHATSRGSSPGPFQLPTIEANVRVKSANDKISVNHDHISVEQAGVPVFSVKWKVKRSSNANK